MHAAKPDRRPSERLRFWQGQTLASADLNTVVTQAETLKAWHSRALHGAYGVVEGLNVKEGETGHVVVGSGSAYDCSGRVLVLRGERTVALPQDADGTPVAAILVLSGVAPAPCACGTGSSAAQATLSWIDPNTFGPDIGVPLAEVGVSGKIAADGPRRLVRPETLPQISFGATVAGATAWRNWTEAGHARLAGIEVNIDTSAAGFTETPCYFAFLNSAPPNSLSLFGFYLERIVDAQPTGFTYSLWIIFPNTQGSRTARPTQWRLQAAQRELSVSWIGVQPSAEAALPEDVGNVNP